MIPYEGIMKEIFPNKSLKEYTRGELALAILLSVSLGVLIVGTVIIAPNIGAVLKLFKPKTKYDRHKIRRTIASLEKRGLISVTKTGGLRPTKKGVSYATYESLFIRKSTWDKRWRLVMFDIPEEKRAARITLSRKVLAMGMRHVQDSVFISPYPCEKEVLDAALFLKVNQYVQVADALTITDSERFKKEFNL